ncbi:MAG: SDR family oxidoreductase [Candidatus Microsaccharimonas sp.]
MNIVNKTILVSGASDGIGKSIAVALAQDGANLVLLGRDASKLEGVKSICENHGVNVEYYAFDITDRHALEEAASAIKEKSSLDIIINNAGIWHKATPLEELAPDLIESVISTNLVSHMLLTRLFIEDMKDRETAILNIVSSAGLQGKAGRTAYAASKFGLRGFTEALRDETFANPIRIGAVFQGGTNTQMFEKGGEAMPLEKYTEPDDLAQVIVFILTRPQKLWLNEVHITY